MPKEMVISANPHETRVAILEEGQLCEYYVEREKEFALVGSIYKGRVTRVLPGMQSAFVDIGLDSDAFLYVSDFLEGVEEFEPIVATVEDKTKKMQEEGGQVFPTTGGTAPAEPPDVEALPAESIAAHPAGNQTDLKGEETQPGNTWTAPPASAGSPQHSSSQDRGRFEGRHRHGRDFGRRGRGGRFGRRGRDDRRFGRELPPSKYASRESNQESGPGEPYVPVILPGESLARYRVPGAVTAGAPTEEIAPNVPPGEPPSIPESPVSDTAEAKPPARDESATSEPGLELRFGSYEAAGAQDQRPERYERPERPGRYDGPRHERYQRPERFDRPGRFDHAERPAYQPSGHSGLEPLPGENIAKWHSTAPAQSTPAAEPAREELGGTAEPRIDQREETHLTREEFGASAEAHATHEAHEELDENAAPDLSPEEAATIAEHVAEAQSEEAEREQLRTDIAAPGDPTEIEAREEASHSGMDAATEENGYELEGDETASEESEDESETAAEEIAAAQAEIEHEAASELPEMEPIVGDAGTEHIGEEPAQAEPERQPFAARVREDLRARMQHPARRGRDRGRRPHHRHYGHHRPQNRRPQLIADLLKQGQEIIVQIAKEPLGKKGARITSHVALPGRYLVYMPTLDHSGVSRKIASAEERSRLRHLVNDAKGTAPGGFIVRTAAASAAPEEVRADVQFLTHTWSEIKSRSEQRKAPSLLHRDLNLVERILRDHMNSDYTAIWVDNEEAYLKVTEFISRFQSSLANRVKLYTKETPIFEEFGIQQEIEKGLRPKVWLKSGGYIVINHTEALVAIDVNTGKFVGKGSTRLEDTIVRTNLEAAKEIVRQMRLRDLGGIIVIDFIDMEDRRNREKVMSALEDALRSDRAPSKMLRFNEFGLIAITRKRTKQALERTLCQPCPYCTGSGMVKSVPTLCYEIQTEARKMAPDIDSGSITLRVHPEIAKALKTRESSLIDELEHWTKKSAIIQADPTLHWEQYDIY